MILGFLQSIFDDLVSFGDNFLYRWEITPDFDGVGEDFIVAVECFNCVCACEVYVFEGFENSVKVDVSSTRSATIVFWNMNVR